MSIGFTKLPLGVFQVGLANGKTTKPLTSYEDRGFVVPLILRYRFVASSFGIEYAKGKGVYAELMPLTGLALLAARPARQLSIVDFASGRNGYYYSVRQSTRSHSWLPPSSPFSKRKNNKTPNLI